MLTELQALSIRPLDIQLQHQSKLLTETPIERA